LILPELARVPCCGSVTDAAAVAAAAGEGVGSVLAAACPGGVLLGVAVAMGWERPKCTWPAARKIFAELRSLAYTICRQKEQQQYQH
jgi:hypothetical protein